MCHQYTLRQPVPSLYLECPSCHQLQKDGKDIPPSTVAASLVSRVVKPIHSRCRCRSSYCWKQVRQTGGSKKGSQSQRFGPYGFQEDPDDVPCGLQGVGVPGNAQMETGKLGLQGDPRLGSACHIGHGHTDPYKRRLLQLSPAEHQGAHITHRSESRKT